MAGEDEADVVGELREWLHCRRAGDAFDHRAGDLCGR